MPHLEDELYEVSLVVNNQQHILKVPAEERLLTTLRTRLHIFSARYGCGTGHCGSCVVLVDHEPVPSCLLLTIRQKNRVIQTVEGFEDDLLMNQLIAAFSEEHAAQCGYCTPGLLLSAKYLLERKQELTESDLRAGISSHICRCTGYYAPLRAIAKVRDHHALD
ncbi:MAG: (2Fe-2S)-binding protein [Sulfobacillus thermosulfidooxidans]|uniref:(2Fe-2S)-binding protein n=1 Tax=Sulfobacillus thermosulfidooxidans TaxID=28034 RepID=A0A2T2X430_SULTH|nr:MAG: (2Fe-2S)-binding protein [Sulfobacillus thermosulfidooxidans]